MDIELLVRRNILCFQPYSCARNEFEGGGASFVYLDANENPYNKPYNRYPDPLQRLLKEKISKYKKIRASQLMIGNGSDEPIDLIFRIFCEPRQDNVVIIDPTYGMYQVAAEINNVDYRKVLLENDFQLNAKKLLEATDKKTKIIFLCSPNNPSGNLLNRTEIVKVLTCFHGIVVIDEAYVDFSGEVSWISDLNRYPNLIVLQTFSKAWGMASVRCGLVFSSEEIVWFFNKVKYPYNINFFTQNAILNQLDKEHEKNNWVQLILLQRKLTVEALQKMNVVEKVYPSDANFILVKVKNAFEIYQKLIQQGIVIRNRTMIALCENCLRVTIGTEEENQKLIEVMKK